MNAPVESLTAAGPSAAVNDAVCSVICQQCGVDLPYRPAFWHAGAVDFEEHRPELTAFCYRMTGSFHDAEDLVQETLFRAWKARDRYDPARASVRTWLYRIAANVCLTALEGRGRRPLPSGLGAPGDDPEGAPLTPALDVPWLEPFPSARFDVEARADLRLAWVAAVQQLSARARAVLILREVLDFPAADVAAQLETTVAAVNSALQRARATMREAGAAAEAEHVRESGDARQRAVIERYARAFEAADVAALVRLLAEDAILEMPPTPLWVRGREDYGRFLRRVFRMRPTGWTCVPTEANGQPALACYHADPAAGLRRAHSLQVVTVDPAGAFAGGLGLVTTNVAFTDPGLFPAFGLPQVLPRD